MFEDFDFSGPGQNVGAHVEYGDGDFYVRSTGHLSVTPSSAFSTASSLSLAPVGKTASFSSSGVHAISAAVNRGVGHGVGSSIAYVGFL